MVDEGRITRRAALACIGSGAVLTGSETFGFTNVTGSRGVNIGTTADPEEALLGIVDNSANIGTVDGDRQEIFYLDDNTDGSFDPAESDVSVVDYADCTDDTTEDCPDVSLGLADSYDYAVVVSCVGTDIADADTMTVRLEMNGTEVSVKTNQTTDNTVETKCSGNTKASGFSSVSAGDVSRNGTQVLSFNPANTQIKKDDIILIELRFADGIDYSNATATVTSGKNSNNSHGNAAFTDADTVEFEATDNIQPDSTVTIEVDGYTITGDSGETYTAFFDRDGDTDSDDFTIE